MDGTIMVKILSITFLCHGCWIWVTIIFRIVLPEESLEQIFVTILSRASFPLVGLLASWSRKESLTISSTVYDSEWGFSLLHSNWSVFLSLPTLWPQNHRISKTVKDLKGHQSPTLNPALLWTQLNDISKCNIHISFEHFQGWWFYHFPGQLVPVPDHPFNKEIIPNVWSKLPIA